MAVQWNGIPGLSVLSRNYMYDIGFHTVQYLMQYPVNLLMHVY